MRIAYLLLVHQSSTQLERLLRAIDTPGNVLGVHVDAKTPKSGFEEIRAVCEAFSNVSMLSRRRVTWGGWSIVAAELAGIAELLDRSREWDHLVCLSGQDFPLVSQRRLRAIFDADPNRNYLSAVPLAQWPTLKLKRLQYPYIELANRVQRIPIRRPIPRAFEIFGGDQWFMITRSFAQHCVTDPLARRIARYSRFTLVPDEMYFSTVIMNSPFRDTCAGRSLRKISWHRSTGASPGTITMADVDWLTSGDECFARKFDQAIDRQVLELLERRLAAQ
jgi:hypothetical protein